MAAPFGLPSQRAMGFWLEPNQAIKKPSPSSQILVPSQITRLVARSTLNILEEDLLGGSCNLIRTCFVFFKKRNNEDKGRAGWALANSERQTAVRG